MSLLNQESWNSNLLRLVKFTVLFWGCYTVADPTINHLQYQYKQVVQAIPTGRFSVGVPTVMWETQCQA